MKKFFPLFLILVLAASALAQVTTAPKTTIAPNSTLPWSRWTVIGFRNNISVTLNVGSVTTLIRGCPVGATVFAIEQQSNATSDTTYSATDNASTPNTYVVPTGGQAFDASDGVGVKFAYAFVTTALAAGNTITFTPQVSDSHANTVDFCLIGALTSAALDQLIANSTSDSTTQTSGSITPSVTNSYGILFSGAAVTGGIFTGAGNVIGAAATPVYICPPVSGRFLFVEFVR